MADKDWERRLAGRAKSAFDIAAKRAKEQVTERREGKEGDRALEKPKMQLRPKPGAMRDAGDLAGRAAAAEQAAREPSVKRTETNQGRTPPNQDGRGRVD